MLEVQSLAFDYMDRPLLGNINFALHKGEILHLRGDNGSGKTTLLRLLAGFLQPLSGLLMYDQEAIYNNIRAYQSKVCYIGHKMALNPCLTVRENLYFNASLTLDLSLILAQFHLDTYADKPCYQLSAGQQKRVSLLRLLMTKASLWLLDEPLVSLDEASIGMLMQCLGEHLVKGGQIVITSHQALPQYFATSKEYCLS